MPTDIAHICLCLQPHDTNPKAKAKECNRQRLLTPLINHVILQLSKIGSKFFVRTVSSQQNFNTK